MERRSFLKTAGILTTGTLLAHSHDLHADTPQLGKNDSVIVLGAGFSGLAAAYYLQKKGIKVTVLECRNRIGGRVFTHQVDKNTGLYAELGAEWVGSSHHRIIELCKEFDIKLIDHRFASSYLINNKFYKADDWKLNKEWETKYTKLINQFASLNTKQKHFFDKISWWKYLVQNGIPESELERLELENSTDFGESIRNVSSAMALSEFSISNENDEMDFTMESGNSMLAHALADKIGREAIVIGKKATKVRQSGKFVEVVCEDGSQYTSNRLICTLPALAVSKMEWIPLFSNERKEALDALQYSRIIKSSVVFKERFWKEEGFSLITDKLPQYIFHGTKGQIEKTGMLVSYTTGDNAAVFSKLSPEQKIREFCQTLKPVFGNVENYVESIGVSYYWGNDPISAGAYAVYGINQWYPVREIIGKSHQKVLFSGEHLSEKWQGFMEGAIETGEAAAKTLAG